MKVLDQVQMDNVSGAGVDMMIGVEGYYKNYDDFSGYLQYAYKNHLNPIYFAEQRQAFGSWCNKMGLDAEKSAQLNGWKKDSVIWNHK